MKIGILAITKGAHSLAYTIAASLPGTILPGKGVAEKLAGNWKKYDGFICVMATGIVVRAIAPLVADKRTDPAVVVIDEKGQYVISLLSGHLGGANELAKKAAKITGGHAVITTASDTLGLVALDLWAKAQNLVANKEDMIEASSQLVNQGKLYVFSEVAVDSLPSGLVQVDDQNKADLTISNTKSHGNGPVFYPRNLVVGTGCNRGTPAMEFNKALAELFSDLQLSPLAIRNLSSIDRKDDEEGLLAFSEEHTWSIEFFTKEEINTVTNVETSQAAIKAVGAIGVAEPTSLLSAGTDRLLSRKRKWQNITMAVAEVPFTLSARVLDR